MDKRIKRILRKIGAGKVINFHSLSSWEAETSEDATRRYSDVRRVDAPHESWGPLSPYLHHGYSTVPGFHSGTHIKVMLLMLPRLGRRGAAAEEAASNG